MKTKKTLSEETKLKISKSNKGTVHSLESRMIQSKKMKGKIPWNKGKTGVFSNESKLKMSRNSIGQVAWNRGKTGIYSEKTLIKMSAAQRGEKSYRWNENRNSYGLLHMSVRQQLGKPNECENCGLIDNEHPRRFNWANISGEYKEDLSDWARLCIICHKLFDGHYGKNQYNKEN
jgi:hypothetical protein